MAAVDVRANPAYTVAVSIAGVAIPADTVICDVVIRSGRRRQDDGLQPASCTLELTESEPGTVAPMVADPLVVTVDGAARFTGRISEITHTSGIDTTTWTVIGIGNIRRLVSALITLPIASESAAARAQRAITAAGFTAVISGGAGYTLTAYGATGDPPETADRVLGDVVTATGAVVQDQGDGSILVQFEDGRLSESQFTPDPAMTITDLEFGQSDDVVNEAVIGYAGGAATATDPASITKYQRHSVSISTSLADVGSAQNRANSIVARLAWPAWTLDQMVTWDPTFHLYTVGALVNVSPLPLGAPVEAPWQGVLEGWEERYQPDPEGAAAVFATYTLAVGDRTHSAETVHWAGVTPSLHWNGVDPATAWNEAISNAALTP